MSKIQKLLIFILIILAIFIRVYRFGSLPLSLNRDEVALGYNAYAIATRGMDEWGQKFPMMFKSFGDYKLPGYVYTLSVLVKLFDTSDFIIRLPSLIAGIAIIFAVRELVKKLKYNRLSQWFITLTLAVSPWSVFYSRVGFEANVGLAAMLWSLVFFSHKNNLHKVFAVILYTYSIITYNTPLLLLPLILVWIFMQKDHNKKHKSILLSVTALLAIGWLFLIQPLIVQKSGITVFSDPFITDQQSQAYSQSKSVLEKVWNQKYVYSSRAAAGNILSSITPQFLVIGGGGNPWHGIPDHGHIYWITYLCAASGVVISLRQRQKKSIFPWFMVVMGLFPAIITVDAPHATRSLIVFIALTIFSALVIEKRPKIMPFLLTILIIEAGLFSKAYFLDFPNNHSATWQVGLKQKIQEASSQHKGAQINITVPQNQPYIYVLLYEKIDPKVYVKSVEYYGPDSAGIEYIKKFDGWSFIGDPNDVQDDIPIIHQNKNGHYQVYSSKIGI